jgi:hypothetical protein
MKFVNRYSTVLFCCLVHILTQDLYAQTSKYIAELEYNDVKENYLNPDNIQLLPYLNINNVFLYNSSKKVLKGSLNWNLRLGLNNQFIKDNTENRYLDKHSLTFDPLELFYQKSIGNFTFSVGRKRIKWGVGYVASPTDIVSSPPPPEDPSDRLFKIKGTDLMEITYVSKNAQYDVYLMPATNANTVFFKDHSAAIRYYRNISLFDVSLVGRADLAGTYQAGINLTTSVGSNLEIHGDGIIISRSKVKYPPYFEEKKTATFRLLGGINYSPRSNYNIVLEYFHIGEGYSAKEWGQYQDLISFYSAQRSFPTLVDSSTDAINTLYDNTYVPMRRNFTFARFLRSNLFVPKLDVEWITFGGLDEIGSLNRFGVYYKFKSRYDLYAHYQFLANSSNSDFNLFGYAQTARIGIKISL